MLHKAFPGVVHNRSHIARLLINGGAVETVSEAFRSLLSPRGRYYREAPKLPFIQTIRKIRAWGGLPVWAHPLLNMNREDVEKTAAVAAGEGLAGIEVYYSEFDDGDTEFMAGVASKNGLAASGGSDFHGKAKPDIKLGVGRGNLNIPFETYLKLSSLVPQDR